MNFFDQRNGLDSTTMWNYSRNKQGKIFSNHKFPIYIPEQTKNHYGDIRYEASKWYHIIIRCVFGMQLISGCGRECIETLGVLKQPYQGKYSKKWSTCMHGWTTGDIFSYLRSSSGEDKSYTSTQQLILCETMWSIRWGNKQKQVKNHCYIWYGDPKEII